MSKRVGSPDPYLPACAQTASLDPLTARRQAPFIPSTWIVLAVAVAVRVSALALLAGVSTERLEIQRDAEAEFWARTIIHDGGFFNPYVPDAKLPSAFRTPIHPIVLAALWHVSGDQEGPFLSLVHWAYLGVSVLAVPLVGALATYAFGKRIGLLASILWALYPPSVYYAIRSTCDATIVSTGLIFAVWQLSRPAAAPPKEALLGVVTGILALVNPSTLSVSLPCNIWRWFRILIPQRWRSVAFFTLGFALTLSPWLIRNRITLGEWTFLRTNFGMELMAGNRDSGYAFVGGETFYLNDDSELRSLRRIGEAGYNRYAEQRAIAWICSRPCEFAALTVRRIGVFWGKEVFYGALAPWTTLTTGTILVLAVIGVFMSLVQRRQVAHLIIPLGTYPTVYYLTHAQARYRFPIEAFLVMFAALPLAAAATRLYSMYRKHQVAASESRNPICTHHPRAERLAVIPLRKHLDFTEARDNYSQFGLRV